MRSKTYQHRQQNQQPIVPTAGPLKVYRADGTIEIRSALTEQQAKRIIGRQRGRFQKGL